MSVEIRCPMCRALLKFAENDEMVRCPYCTNSFVFHAEVPTSPQSTVESKAEAIQAYDQNHHSSELSAVAVLAQAGKMIEAIKLYRQITNSGLAEAKNAVDNIRAGRSFQTGQASDKTYLDTLEGSSSSSDQKAELKRLIQSKRKIEAIKLYREITGVGLKEAKDAVEAMEAGG